MTIKGSMARVAGTTTSKQPDVLWDSEGYPVRKGDEVNLVSARSDDFRTAKVTEVTATYCAVQVIEGAKPVKIPVTEIQNQHDRLISKTAKEQIRTKNPNAKITEPPRGELKTNITKSAPTGPVKPRRLGG